MTNQFDDLLKSLGTNGHNPSDLEAEHQHQRAQQAENEAQNAPLDLLRKLKKWDELAFVAVEQVGTTHLAKYYGVNKDGQKVFLGNATELFSFEKVRSNIMAQTGVILGKEHKKQWDLIVALLIKARSQPMDIGDDERDLIGYIANWFTTHPYSAEIIPDTPLSRQLIIEWSPGQSMDTQIWYFGEGRIIVIPESLATWISYRHQRRFEEKSLRTSLALLGFESYPMSARNDGKPNSRRVWRSKPGWADKVVNTEVALESPL